MIETNKVTMHMIIAKEKYGRIILWQFRLKLKLPEKKQPDRKKTMACGMCIAISRLQGYNECVHKSLI